MPNHRFRSIALSIAALALFGCKTPLQKAVREWSPQFDARQPASSELYLGHRMIKDSPDLNTCYSGAVSTAPAVSYSTITVRYNGESTASLSHDFNEVVTTSMSAKSKLATVVMLRNTEVYQLDSVYLDPDQPCARDEDLLREFAGPKGKVDEVIVRAGRAEGLVITSDDGHDNELNVHADKLGSSAVLKSSDTRKVEWSGANLGFAFETKKFVTKRMTRRTQNVSDHNGVTESLGGCYLSMTGQDPQAGNWTGRWFCEGGPNDGILVSGRLNGRTTVSNKGRSVSYSIRVDPAKFGAVDIELDEWNVSDRP